MKTLHTRFYLFFALTFISYPFVNAQKSKEAVIYPTYTADCATSPNAAMDYLLNSRRYSFDSSMTHMYRLRDDTSFYEYDLRNYPNKYPGLTPPGQNSLTNSLNYDDSSKLKKFWHGGKRLSIGEGRNELPFFTNLMEEDNNGNSTYHLINFAQFTRLAVLKFSFNSRTYPQFLYSNNNGKVECYVLITVFTDTKGTGTRTYWIWPVNLQSSEVQTFSPSTPGGIISFEKPVFNYDNFLTGCWFDSKLGNIYLKFNYPGVDSLLQWNIEKKEWARSQIKRTTYKGYPSDWILAENGKTYIIEAEKRKKSYDDNIYISEFDISSSKTKKQYKVPVEGIQNVGLSSNSPFAVIYDVYRVKLWKFKEDKTPITLFMPRLSDRGYYTRIGNLKPAGYAELSGTFESDYLESIVFSADGKRIAIIWFYNWCRLKTDAAGNPVKENNQFIILKGHREFIDVYELPSD